MKILICPLNWGLGHATRCVPLVRNYISEGHEVVVVADGYPLAFLKLQFPTLRFIEYKSYNIRYSKGNSLVFAMLQSFPAIVAGIIREHKWLDQLVQTEHFDQVVSDNRFGMWSKRVHSIYITHQLMIKMPRAFKWLEPLVWLVHRFIINRYNACYIPDVEGVENLSGDLAHKYPLPLNARFIGHLSRFSELTANKPDKRFDILAIVSGPEPQRTLFENQLIERYKSSSERVLIVCGTPNNQSERNRIDNICRVSHLTDYEFVTIIAGVEKIISRSGYSSIMDFKILNCLHKVEFTPTPGQTEQNYLFDLHGFK